MCLNGFSCNHKSQTLFVIILLRRIFLAYSLFFFFFIIISHKLLQGQKARWKFQDLFPQVFRKCLPFWQEKCWGSENCLKSSQHEWGIAAAMYKSPQTIVSSRTCIRSVCIAHTMKCQPASVRKRHSAIIISSMKRHVISGSLFVYHILTASSYYLWQIKSKCITP